jgi:ABC-type uncharacterized transport system substrate-binding protein
MVRQTKMNMAISQYFSHAYSLGKQVEISPPKAIFLKHGQNSGKLMVKG